MSDVSYSRELHLFYTYVAERRRQEEAKAREIARKKEELVRQQQAWQSQQPAHHF
jgi:hypothetical protein